MGFLRSFSLALYALRPMTDGKTPNCTEQWLSTSAHLYGLDGMPRSPRVDILL